jgi:NADPH:quinone reductase-like Zn-dependent oxidoreductase
MSTQLMQALQFSNYGGPEVASVQARPRPTPQSDQVLIRVQAAGLNPVDWKTREGGMKWLIDYPMPFVPGWDVSGVIEPVGGDVTGVKAGQAVYAMLGVPAGGVATHVVTAASAVGVKPESLSHVEAAASAKGNTFGTRSFNLPASTH